VIDKLKNRNEDTVLTSIDNNKWESTFRDWRPGFIPLYVEEDWIIYKNMKANLTFLGHNCKPASIVTSYYEARNICTKCHRPPPIKASKLYKMFKFAEEIM